MLVLSRKMNEKIVIGDGIVVTVVKIDRNQVPVFREEILTSDHPAISPRRTSTALPALAGS